jgi:hypothetical protein
VSFLTAAKIFNVTWSTPQHYLKTGILPYNPDIFTQSDFLANEREQEVVDKEDNINQSPLISSNGIVTVPHIN